jgi:hypothetical protein
VRLSGNQGRWGGREGRGHPTCQVGNGRRDYAAFSNASASELRYSVYVCTPSFV